MSLKSLLTIGLVLAGACRSSAPASLPVVVAAPSSQESGDGIARTEYHGVPGLFFTFEAWRNVQINFRLERKTLELALVTETTERQIAEKESSALRKNQESVAWRLTWLPPLAFLGGATITAAIVGVAVAVFREMPGLAVTK